MTLRKVLFSMPHHNSSWFRATLQMCRSATGNCVITKNDQLIVETLLEALRELGYAERIVVERTESDSLTCYRRTEQGTKFLEEK